MEPYWNLTAISFFGQEIMIEHFSDAVFSRLLFPLLRFSLALPCYVLIIQELVRHLGLEIRLIYVKLLYIMLSIT